MGMIGRDKVNYLWRFGHCRKCLDDININESGTLGMSTVIQIERNATEIVWDLR